MDNNPYEPSLLPGEEREEPWWTWMFGRFWEVTIVDVLFLVAIAFFLACLYLLPAVQSKPRPRPRAPSATPEQVEGTTK